MEEYSSERWPGTPFTAHNLDYSEEIFFLKLWRGIKITNLSGIKVIHDDGVVFSKPMLSVRK